jgi:MYXO-CTERM domain-containing protein
LTRARRAGDPFHVRISRRSLGAIVVLGVALASCYEADHLSTTAQKAVVFMPATSYDFGTVPVFSNNGTNPDPYFVIRAQSETDVDTVKSITPVQPGCGSDFIVDDPQPLPAQVYCADMGSTGYGGGSSVTTCTYIDYNFGAHFHPSQPGSQTCEVDVVTNDMTGSGTTTPVFLYGNALAATYSMSAQPSHLDFGDLPLNTLSTAQLVTVKNIGGSQITISGTNADSAHFPVTPSVTTPVTLGPSMSQMFQVQCQTDGQAVAHHAMLTFTTGATQGTLSQTVTLDCNATTTTITASPTPVNLGTHLLGDGGSTIPVTLKNNGTGSATLDNFRLANTPGTEVTIPGQVGGLTLPPTMSAIINVQYLPTTERDFGPLGSLMFDANTVPTSVPLVGGAHMGSIGTSPASIDFGPVCAGGSASQDLTVYANASGDVTLSAPTAPPPPFAAMLSGTAPITLMAHHGNEATITATAAPMMAATPGDRMATLNLPTNIPGMSQVPISVHALVLAGGIAPNPNIVHFGPNDLGMPSSAKTVTVTNCGPADLTLSDAAITGANADEFAIVSPADVHVTIAQTKSQDFLVVMSPKTAGQKTAQLVFTYPGGSQMVALDGMGYGGGGGSDGSTVDRETYYACSVGTPGGLLPLAVAGLLLRRRRRR